MQYRIFPATGDSLSLLGFGAMGFAGWFGPIDDNDAIRGGLGNDYILCGAGTYWADGGEALASGVADSDGPPFGSNGCEDGFEIP